MQTLGKHTLWVGLLMSGFAQADISHISDNGWYTYDSQSGLYWLDVTETKNMTWLEVNAELAPGGRFDGWRFAGHAEVETLWLGMGIQRQGNPCQYTGAVYCDNWSGDNHRDEIGLVIDLFGNTLDPHAALKYTYDTTTPPMAVYGMLKDEDIYIADPDTFVRTALARENGNSRELRSRNPVQETDDHHAAHGSWLVRSTPPAPLPPLPDTVPPNAVDFDNVMLEDLGLKAACIGGPGNSGVSGATYADFCSGHFVEPINNATAEIKIGLPSSFDRGATPYLRISGFDFRDYDIYDNQTVCDAASIHHSGDIYLEDAQGKHYLAEATLAPAPQGGDWCRVSFDTELQYLPGLAADSAFPSIATVATIGVEYQSGSYIEGVGFDNIIVETLDENVDVTFTPYAADNEIRPKDAYFVTIGVATTSISAGDDRDFDALTIDPATVVVGPASAPNIAIPQTLDFDNDGDTDLIFGFRVEDSGIGCVDYSVTLGARDLSGNPLAGRDVIVPINCEEQATLDVDPFNPGNEIRPNESYTVPVAILSTQAAQGEPGDIDATQIDPATLRFGPNATPHIGAAIVSDVDGDADADVIFGFDAYDAGIACGDTSLEMTGALYSTLPIEGSDSIATIECSTGSCHP